VWALTLLQPWASLIAIGAKRIETRAWQTPHRGPLAIHAHRKLPAYARELFWSSPYFERLSEAGYGSPFALPLRAIVGVAEIDDVLQVPHADMLPYYATDQTWRAPPIPERDTDEWHFGDFRPGRYLYLLTNIRRVSPPIATPGSRGLWIWDEAGFALDRLVEV